MEVLKKEINNISNRTYNNLLMKNFSFDNFKKIDENLLYNNNVMSFLRSKSSDNHNKNNKNI